MAAAAPSPGGAWEHPVGKRSTVRAGVVASLGLLLGAGCAVDQAPLTAEERAKQRQNLREVRGSQSMYHYQTGDPQGFGKIPPGR